MVKAKRGVRNPPKYITPTVEGNCPYCHKHVKSVDNHIHDKHKKEKLVKR